jgi:hypothetical protein
LRPIGSWRAALWPFIDLTLLFVAILGLLISTLFVPTTSAVPPCASILLLVGRVLRAHDRPALRPGHIRRFEPFLSLDNVELDFLVLAETALGLARVVLGDGRLVHKHILVVVVAVDEAVAVLDVEPLHHAGYFSDCKKLNVFG